jgi:hypothetical protein
MDAKHTPGPWRISPRTNNMIDVLHDNNEKGAITKALCRVQARESWVAEAESNARLIAAAPELFEVALRLVNDGLSTGLVRDARDAIAKATGER